MPALASGAAWSVLVGVLLRRVLLQFRAFRTGRLAAAPADAVASSVAVVVPARDEAANIGPCLAGLAAQDGLAGRLAVVAVDDDSRDGTAEAVRRLAARDPRVRLVEAGPLPAGWLGKPWACWRGTEATAGAAGWLCFVDADVRAAPALLASAVAAAEAEGLGLLSLQPFQELGSFWERLVIPAGMLMIACAKRDALAGDAARVGPAVNGQFMLVRADVYHAVGGHAAVCGEVCEDVELARRVARAGHRVRVLSAGHLARTRMYRDLPSLWEGFAKNAVEIMGSAPATLAAAAAGVAVAWAASLFPLRLGLALRRKRDAPTLVGFAAACAASGTVLGVELGTLRHFRASPFLLPLFPLGVTVAAALACESARLRRAGHVRWKGRTYRLADPAGRTP